MMFLGYVCLSLWLPAFLVAAVNAANSNNSSTLNLSSKSYRISTNNLTSSSYMNSTISSRNKQGPPIPHSPQKNASLDEDDCKSQFRALWRELNRVNQNLDRQNDRLFGFFEQVHGTRDDLRKYMAHNRKLLELVLKQFKVDIPESKLSKIPDITIPDLPIFNMENSIDEENEEIESEAEVPVKSKLASKATNVKKLTHSCSQPNLECNATSNRTSPRKLKSVSNQYNRVINAKSNVLVPKTVSFCTDNPPPYDDSTRQLNGKAGAQIEYRRSALVNPSQYNHSSNIVGSVINGNDENELFSGVAGLESIETNESLKKSKRVTISLPELDERDSLDENECSPNDKKSVQNEYESDPLKLLKTMPTKSTLKNRGIGVRSDSNYELGTKNRNQKLEVTEVKSNCYYTNKKITFSPETNDSDKGVFHQTQ